MHFGWRVFFSKSKVCNKYFALLKQRHIITQRGSSRGCCCMYCISPSIQLHVLLSLHDTEEVLFGFPKMKSQSADSWKLSVKQSSTPQPAERLLLSLCLLLPLPSHRFLSASRVSCLCICVKLFLVE